MHVHEQADKVDTLLHCNTGRSVVNVARHFLTLRLIIILKGFSTKVIDGQVISLSPCSTILVL